MTTQDINIGDSAKETTCGCGNCGCGKKGNE